jgi:hypothetical protein
MLTAVPLQELPCLQSSSLAATEPRLREPTLELC